MPSSPSPTAHRLPPTLLRVAPNFWNENEVAVDQGLETGCGMRRGARESASV